MTAIQISQSTSIPARHLCKHVGIFGATGTGKTTTVAAIVERLGRQGVPVIALDAKGDLESLATHGPVHPTFSLFDLGPDILAQALALSDAQSGALSIAYAFCKAHDYRFDTLDELRLVLNQIVDMRDDLARVYGLVSPASVAAIHRAILRIEREEPGLFQRGGLNPLDLADTGGTTVIRAGRLADTAGLYGAVAAHLLNTTFRGLQEVGDVAAPGMAIVIDEAHLIFDKAPPGVVAMIERAVRLIRSRGVALIFATQSPTDLPTGISGQLGTRIVHGMRGMTMAHLQAAKATAYTMPGKIRADDILGLGVGEALVTTPGKDGVPTEAKLVRIVPGQIRPGPVEIQPVAATPYFSDVPPSRPLPISPTLCRPGEPVQAVRPWTAGRVARWSLGLVALIYLSLILTQ